MFNEVFYIEFCSISETHSRSKIAVVSYPRYCRYRATLKRLENVEDEWLRNTLVEALGGFVSSGPDTRVMFCKVRKTFSVLRLSDSNFFFFGN